MNQALIVVDYQNDFVDGALGFDGAPALQDAICQAIATARQAGSTVIFTYDCHAPDYLQTQEGRNLPVEHCIKGTDGAELFGTVATMRQEADPVFYKNGFGSLALANYLTTQTFDKITLVGVVSHICVISNAVLAKAALPEAEIVIDAAATDGFDPQLHQSALDVMANLQMTIANRKED